MTIRQALHDLDQSKFNTVSQEKKIGWLSLLDLMFHHELVENYLDDFGGFDGYDATTDLDTVLQIPSPYDEIYGYWLESRVDYENGETDRFNNANAMYQAAWQRFVNHYHRTHTPKNQGDFH